jgi:hypothetical protein
MWSNEGIRRLGDGDSGRGVRMGETETEAACGWLQYLVCPGLQYF